MGPPVRLRRCAFLRSMLVAGVSVGPSVGADVVLDPWASPSLCRQLADEPAQLLAFDRVHLVAVRNGEFLRPPSPPPFRVWPALDDGTLLPRLRGAVRGSRCATSVAAELLRWEDPSLQSSGVFRRVPEYEELRSTSGCGSCSRQIGYASPFHELVSAAVLAIASSLDGLAPSPDSFTFRLELPVGMPSGFSRAARVAYIRHAGKDPIDLDFTDPEQVEPWRRWREQQLTGLLREVVAIIRSRRPAAEIRAWVTLPAVAPGPEPKPRVDWSAADWRSWLAEGLVTEVLADADWHLPATVQAYRDLLPVGDAAPGAARVIPVVPTRYGTEAPSIKQALANLRGAGVPMGRIAVLPAMSDDWEMLLEAVREAGGP